MAANEAKAGVLLLLLEGLGLVEIEEQGGARHRKAPRTGFERIDVQVEL